MFNWSKVHLYRSNSLQNPYFKAGFEQGCDSAVIIATNPNTNGIAKKLNFSHYKSVHWSDYKDTKTGEDWFPADKLPYTIVNSYYKLLKDRTGFDNTN